MDDASASTYATIAAQAINTAGNVVVSGELNRRAEKFNREMIEKQRNWALEDWHMQNAYNDPSAQMARLKNANLNPHLVYGNGTDVKVGDVRSTPNQSAPAYHMPRIDMDMQPVLMAALGVEQAQANISRTKAETERIRTDTVGMDFTNKMNDAIGVETMVRNYAAATDKLEVSSKREAADFDAWAAAGFSGFATDDPRSPQALAHKAGLDTAVMKLEHARITKDVDAARLAQEEYKAGLVKAGVPPDTPWFYKLLIVPLMKEAGITSVADLMKTLNPF